MSPQVEDLLRRFGPRKDRSISESPQVKGQSKKETSKEKRGLPAGKSQPGTSEDLKVPMATLLEKAVGCIDRFQSSVDNPDHSSKTAEPEAQLVQILRKVFSKVSLDQSKTEIAFNEIDGTAFLLLHFQGTLTPKYVR